MRLLIIGDANSIWVKEYCNKIIIPSGMETCICSHANERFADFYLENGIDVHVEELKKKNFLYRIIQFLNELSYIRRQNADYLQVHYCSRYNLRLGFFSKGKRIATFWGSDILRVRRRDILELAIYLTRFNKIILLTENMQKKFSEIWLLKCHLKKLEVFDFGVTNLEEIKRAANDNYRTTSRERFGIPRDKYVISIGYNKSEAQQHDKVVKAVANISDKTKNKLFLLFHMSYGNCSSEYYQNLINLLEKVGIEYKIIEKYLTGEDLAYIRLATDMYINAQKTDALAATLHEYFFAEKIVLNPSWIEYKELDDLGVFYLKYRDFNDIPLLIEQCFKTRNDRYFVERNKNVIWNNYSWDSRKKDWLKVYT